MNGLPNETFKRLVSGNLFVYKSNEVEEKKKEILWIGYLEIFHITKFFQIWKKREIWHNVWNQFVSVFKKYFFRGKIKLTTKQHGKI